MDFEYPWNFGSRRSAVMSNEGMVSTSHPLAVRIGASVLEAGGNAQTQRSQLRPH
jgi:gamma-glutamyltranspeptidase